MFMWTAALTQMNSGTGKCIYKHFLSIYENMMEDGEFFCYLLLRVKKQFSQSVGKLIRNTKILLHSSTHRRFW